jgi:hypothetical protein
VREVIEFGRIGCLACERLSPSERVCRGKERTPGRNPVTATELEDFRSGLLLKPKVREVSSPRVV